MILNPGRDFYILHDSSLRSKRKGLSWFNGLSHSITTIHSDLDLKESIWSFGPLPHLCSTWHSNPHADKINHPHPPVKYLHMAYLLLRKRSFFWNRSQTYKCLVLVCITYIHTVPVRAPETKTVLEKVCFSKISHLIVKNILHPYY